MAAASPGDYGRGSEKERACGETRVQAPSWKVATPICPFLLPTPIQDLRYQRPPPSAEGGRGPIRDISIEDGPPSRAGNTGESPIPYLAGILDRRGQMTPVWAPQVTPCPRSPPLLAMPSLSYSRPPPHRDCRPRVLITRPPHPRRLFPLPVATSPPALGFITSPHHEHGHWPAGPREHPTPPPPTATSRASPPSPSTPTTLAMPQPTAPLHRPHLLKG
eukprot:XP_020406401.1 leucine-rich repeat extensin-like protein 2 [Zea mays]